MTQQPLAGGSPSLLSFMDGGFCCPDEGTGVLMITKSTASQGHLGWEVSNNRTLSNRLAPKMK
jgi:hypothetical protein